MTPKTYKVTYFDAQMEVITVEEYHGMHDAEVGEIIINNMRARDAVAVRILKGDRNITAGFYHFESERIAKVIKEMWD